MIPVVDVFAGPGGLGEGFSRFNEDSTKGSPFKICLSIEKDFHAHRTLELRAFFRQFPKGVAPDDYYDYVRHPNAAKREDLLEKYWEGKIAQTRAWRAELGGKDFPDKVVREKIKEFLPSDKPWVLIGGPPCQAYSLVGRARRSKQTREEFEKLREHFLYRYYLRIIRDHKPSIFIMENVRGILSSRIGMRYVFPLICRDMKAAGYELYPLAYDFSCGNDSTSAEKYLVKSEEFGIPQRRHRVFIIGVEKSIKFVPDRLHASNEQITVYDVIGDLPRIRSGISRSMDSSDEWSMILKSFITNGCFKGYDEGRVKEVLGCLDSNLNRGGDFIETTEEIQYRKDWFFDKRLGGILQHSSRTHMADDIRRYLFVSLFGQIYNRSPKLPDFPTELLPNHQNVLNDSREIPFDDRFRVQLYNLPGTTVTCHIAKDGHYYIHPDPLQCRSLTVREAARIQTFPDNYFFEGTRTEQYRQIGNAVPPLLAIQIAEVVFRLLQNARIT